MARDAEATRERLLLAACDEFSRVGHAGARVERIATAAGTNVRMIYAYFGDKSALFDASLAHLVREMAEAVPPRPEDMPGWAAALVEHHDRDPRALRVSMWAQLERPETTIEPLEVYAAKVATVASAAATGLLPADVLMFVYAIAQAWHLSPAGLAAEGSITTSARAEAARIAVERLVRGSGPGIA
ncbi:TetR/AcrR family transcriptional regulator [Agrococcus sp. SGAir0287]|uniref:TetR/AcrR family transcriptional regulator n=1 Tax=Agrococcus sp. SGAir0287 TaxID=2070347 RepID=UPI0010CD0FDC|nr:TetR family transcriptional regulator [Agrococcus sp. SGAir0287]QCR20425.1 TetR/AcrR family transcriptional regulator [Agrococcus sp. SGAir0287]